jgi:hypothetical protein
MPHSHWVPALEVSNRHQQSRWNVQPVSALVTPLSLHASRAQMMRLRTDSVALVSEPPALTLRRCPRIKRASTLTALQSSHVSKNPKPSASKVILHSQLTESLTRRSISLMVYLRSSIMIRTTSTFRLISQRLETKTPLSSHLFKERFL